MPPEHPASGPVPRRATVEPRLGTRTAAACFVAGIRLLTFADAAWAHAIGVLCLFGFVVGGFLAIVLRALADDAPADRLRRRSKTQIE